MGHYKKKHSRNIEYLFLNIKVNHKNREAEKNALSIKELVSKTG